MQTNAFQHQGTTADVLNFGINFEVYMEDERFIFSKDVASFDKPNEAENKVHESTGNWSAAGHSSELTDAADPLVQEKEIPAAMNDMFTAYSEIMSKGLSSFASASSVWLEGSVRMQQEMLAPWQLADVPLPPFSMFGFNWVGPYAELFMVFPRIAMAMMHDQVTVVSRMAEARRNSFDSARSEWMNSYERGMDVLLDVATASNEILTMPLKAYVAEAA